MTIAAGRLAGSPAQGHVPPEDAEEEPSSEAELVIQLEPLNPSS
jgi:hypothetical protein